MKKTNKTPQELALDTVWDNSMQDRLGNHTLLLSGGEFMNLCHALTPRNDDAVSEALEKDIGLKLDMIKEVIQDRMYDTDLRAEAGIEYVEEIKKLIRQTLQSRAGQEGEYESLCEVCKGDKIVCGELFYSSRSKAIFEKLNSCRSDRLKDIKKAEKNLKHQQRKLIELDAEIDTYNLLLNEIEEQK